MVESCVRECKGTGLKNRDKVTVQRLKTVAEGAVLDDANVIDPSVDANWTTHATRWAEVTETGGAERVNGRQVQATTTHLIVLRSDPTTRDIKQQMRVALPSFWGSQTVQIESKAVSREEVVLQCETRSPS